MTKHTGRGVMLMRGLFLGLILSGAGGAVADPTPTVGRSKELEERFRLADRNRDGELSRAEAGQTNWLVKQVERFESLDVDRSGTVTLAEIGAAINAQVEAWLQADIDRDGRISAAEARAQPGSSLEEVFRQADEGDGFITREQLQSLSERSYYEGSELPSVAPNIFEKRF